MSEVFLCLFIFFLNINHKLVLMVPTVGTVWKLVQVLNCSFPASRLEFKLGLNSGAENLHSEKSPEFYAGYCYCYCAIKSQQQSGGRRVSGNVSRAEQCSHFYCPGLEPVLLIPHLCKYWICFLTWEVAFSNERCKQMIKGASTLENIL